jgi:hypothetical protein
VAAAVGGPTAAIRAAAQWPRRPLAWVLIDMQGVAGREGQGSGVLRGPPSVPGQAGDMPPIATDDDRR